MLRKRAGHRSCVLCDSASVTVQKRQIHRGCASFQSDENGLELGGADGRAAFEYTTNLWYHELYTLKADFMAYKLDLN